MSVVRVLFLLMMGLVFVACDRGTIGSDQLAADSNGNNSIYRNYRLDYNEEHNESMISATFTVGGRMGTTVLLKGPSSIKFNGNNPLVRTDNFDSGEVAAFYAGLYFMPTWLLWGATGTSYHEVKKGMIGTASFDFVDPSGNLFIDSAYFSKLELSLPESTSVNGFDIRVFGELDGEVVARLEQGKQTAYVSAQKDNMIRVSSEDLTGFSVGEIELRVEVRKYDLIEKDSKSLGGSISTNYYFSPRMIELR